MEQKNLFTAIVLSIVVFMVWNYFFMPAQPELPPVGPTHEEVIKKSEAPVTRFDVTEKMEEIKSDAHARITNVHTPLYDITLSSQGAVVKQVKLKNYKAKNTPDSDFKSMIDPELSQGTYDVSFKNKGVLGIDSAIYSVSTDERDIDATQRSQSLTYTFTSENGIIVEKTFEFKPDTYVIACQVTVKNASAQNFNDELAVHLTNRIQDKSQIAFEGPAFYLNDALNEIKTKKIEDNNRFSGNVKWLAIEDRYFLMGMIPEDQSDSTILLAYDEPSDVISTSLTKPTGILIPGTQKDFHYSIYNGPKSLSLLKSIGFKLDKVVDFGMFDFIAKPCLMLMGYIYHNLIGNYGVAIIILTILFKIILWPLGSKSYKSMNDMKKLQPLVAEIREKHKANKQKMNEEMMNLYKTYKVNPLSGCLPMVVQMPIFFAFYKMLYQSIELRHAPFFGWITDLSAPDRLFHFGFTIPFFEPPTGIPVLTLLMGASMFIQQKMAPPAGDPAQAKMMMLMPVFMTFIFMNFSSGLVLYWLVNNIVSILQQYYIMKKNA